MTNLEYQKIRRKMLKDEGICVDCRRPERTLDGHTVCAVCRGERSEREERRQLRLAQQEFAERMSA